VNDELEASVAVHQAEIRELHAQIRRMRTVLHIAVSGIRELEDIWSQVAHAARADDTGEARIYRDVVSDLSLLLHRIEAAS
jgi:hypothetical protein